MAKIDIQYHQLLNNILEKGYLYDDPNREGVKRLEIPSYTFRHEFKDGFPAITTKKLHYKNVVTELLWFLKGDTNIKYLIDNGCNIWNKDGYKFYLKNYELYPLGKNKMSFEEWLNKQKNGYSKHSGDLGRIYGYQWRNFGQSSFYDSGEDHIIPGVDQIKDLIQGLKDKPLGTEHIINAWNPADKPDMALPPCHYGFQIVVRPLNYIERFQNKNPSINGITIGEWGKDDQIQYGFELHWQQRSVDTFLGLPYNIASYATLALILEKITGYKALAIQGDLKKVHLYDNSINAVKEQLSRDPSKYDPSKLKFKEDGEDPSGFIYNLQMGYLENNCTLNDLIEEMQIDDFILENYKSYPAINVKMLERDE